MPTLNSPVSGVHPGIDFGRVFRRSVHAFVRCDRRIYKQRFGRLAAEPHLLRSGLFLPRVLSDVLSSYPDTISDCREFSFLSKFMACLPGHDRRLASERPIHNSWARTSPSKTLVGGFAYDEHRGRIEELVSCRVHRRLFNSRLSSCYLDKVKSLQCHDKPLRGSGALP
jgi:hypothetical protein